MDLGVMYAAAFRRALLLTGHRPSAEDAAQEAVARLLGQKAGLVRNPGAWLMRVASRLAYDVLRRHQRELPVAELPEQPDLAPWSADAAADPAGQVVQQEEIHQVRAALSQLAPRDRTLLLLRHSGASYQEIATVIKCAPGSVGTLLARAERRFKACYEAIVADPSDGR